MPIKDPELRRKAQREQKKTKRQQDKIERLQAQVSELTGKKPTVSATASSPPAPTGVSAKDFDLDKLAEEIRMDADNLSIMGSLNLRGALALTVIALARTALKGIEVKNVRDVLALLEWGTTTLDQVIQARGSLGADDTIPADEQQLHEELLNDPVAIEHAQALVSLHSQVVIARHM